MALSAGDSGGAGITRNSVMAAGGAAPYAAKTQPPPPSAYALMSAGGAAPYAAKTQPAPAPYVQPYQSPYQAPMQQAPIQQAPAPQQQTFFQPEQPAVPQQPMFAPGGRQEFNQWSPEQQQLASDQWLGGDSDYTAQTGMYQKALDDFIRRITGRIEGFNTDAASAVQGNLKNEAMSGDQLGSDFAARGLSYSGLFDQSRNKLLDRYKEGRGNIEKNRVGNVQNAENEQADYTAENQISQQNARRASLLRMAAQQQLLDSQFGI